MASDTLFLLILVKQILKKLHIKSRVVIHKKNIVIYLDKNYFDFTEFAEDNKFLYVELTNDPRITLKHNVLIYSQDKKQMLKINKKTGWLYVQMDKHFKKGGI